MAQLHCEVVTAERKVFEDDVTMLVAPGVEGQLGILPQHAPLMTALSYGELQIKREGQEDIFIAIGRGFMEVGPYHVIVLADSAERADEIDIARAEEARQRAEKTMARIQREDVDYAEAEAALRRSIIRMKVANRVQRSPRRRPDLE